MNHCITWWTSFNTISTFVCHVTRISTFSTTNKSTPICITMSGISLIFCICTIYTRKRIEIEMSDNDVMNDLLIFALRSFSFPLVNWISNIIFFIGHSRCIKNQQKYKKPIKVYTNYSFKIQSQNKAVGSLNDSLDHFRSKVVHLVVHLFGTPDHENKSFNSRGNGFAFR